MIGLVGGRALCDLCAFDRCLALLLTAVLTVIGVQLKQEFFFILL
jgi:hypothetical protein